MRIGYVSFVGLILASAGAASASSGRPAPETAPTVTVSAERAGRVSPPPSRLHPDRQIELLARQVGQMILIGFPGADPAEEWPMRVAGIIRDGRVGGVVLFAENVRSPAELRRLTAMLTASGGPRRPFIAIDQEGGKIQRLTKAKGFTRLPSARAVAQMDLAKACGLYRDTATELRELGINVNLGPVVDLDSNPRSPAIGLKGRSYGVEPGKVAAYAEEFIRAHEAAGVLTAAKHFPGHGSAVLDPHERPVDISTTWREPELEPYADLLAARSPDMIMVGHLFHPRFSDGNLPASLSRRTLTGELRRHLAFAGLIVTDDLRMGAITSRFSIETAAVKAIAAGADLIIIANQNKPDPTVVDRVIAAVVGAIAAGRISPHAIDQTEERILEARRKIAAGPHDADGCPKPGRSVAGAEKDLAKTR